MNSVWLTVVTSILAATVAFLGWTAQTLYGLNAEVATIKRQQDTNTESIKAIQDHGSPIIQAVMVRLEELQKGQARIEKALDDHMKEKRP